MKTFRLIAASFAFAVVFAVSAFAQAAATTPTGKIGLINTFAFGDEKAGITKYRNALGSVDAEFKPANDKLRTMLTKYQALQKEIETFRQQATNPAVPVNAQTVQAKADEYQGLERDIKREQEDAKAKYERRYQTVVGPVYSDILKALNDFAKQKGYAVILDGAKLEESGILMGFDEKYNITTEFIQFYNTRPAGAATANAAKPK